ncbi:MAG: MotA/TolQ/ExbB proton channel family protein [Planctomycetota bacterium]|nr:MAG: MotA/TolQ/ExbB proton channel family protein [Planctomycetota bacterium]
MMDFPNHRWWLPAGEPVFLLLALLAAALVGILVYQFQARRRGLNPGLTPIALALVACAPLLGLLGTVSGLIESLGSLAHGHDAAGVGSGIGRALVTTQVGLLIAVPGLIAVHLINRQSGDGGDEA